MRYTEFGLTGGFTLTGRPDLGTIAADRQKRIECKTGRCRVTDEADLGVDCNGCAVLPPIRCALSAQVAVQSVAEYSG